MLRPRGRWSLTLHRTNNPIFGAQSAGKGRIQITARTTLLLTCYKGNNKHKCTLRQIECQQLPLLEGCQWTSRWTSVTPQGSTWLHVFPSARPQLELSSSPALPGLPGRFSGPALQDCNNLVEKKPFFSRQKKLFSTELRRMPTYSWTYKGTFNPCVPRSSKLIHAVKMPALWSYSSSLSQRSSLYMKQHLCLPNRLLLRLSELRWPSRGQESHGCPRNPHAEVSTNTLKLERAASTSWSKPGRCPRSVLTASVWAGRTKWYCTVPAAEHPLRFSGHKAALHSTLRNWSSTVCLRPLLSLFSLRNDEQILSTNRSHCLGIHCFTCLSLTCSTKQRGSTLKTNTELHPELTANTRTLCTHVSAVCICELEHRKSNVNSWSKCCLKCCFHARKKQGIQLETKEQACCSLLPFLLHSYICKPFIFGVPETQEHKLLHIATSECPWEEQEPRAITWYPEINSSCYF